ncbi:MAG: tetratricopeptide repeat protein [Barnesiella sp.]|nr:tetratricopeptide repeat protein [Barnesiella sp.]
MNKTVCYSLALGGLVALSGCNSKMAQFKQEYFSTNPNPLEVVGQEVPAVVTANIPAKFFKKNASVLITPVLVYATGETSSAPLQLQGEKVRGNAPVVSYTQGGAVTIPANYVYDPQMLNSELFLDFSVEQGSKKYVLPRVKVADGVIATATLADAATVTPAIAADAFQREIMEKYSADIRFLINQAIVRDNQLNTIEMKTFNEQLRRANDDDKLVIEEVNIKSYASPEGSLDFNARLAENREKSTKAYFNDQMKKDNITEFGELTADFTAEDWEGFQKLVAASDIQDKDLILSVLDQFKDPEVREREIRNLSSVFDVLAQEILPQLRYSRLTASVKVIGKSDDEINNLIDTDPSKLSVEELLYAATITDDPKRQESIYKTVTELYPNDYRGYNNLGKLQYQKQDYTTALSNFKKAAQLNPNSKEASMNQGLLSLVNNDLSSANRSFASAAGLDGLGDALGVYYLTTGDNAAAVKAFGSSKTNNAALAQILTKDYASAKNTLSAVANPDATTYYLMAVVGARTNNSSMVNDNLQKAIKLDPTLAEKAKNDLEFANTIR